MGEMRTIYKVEALLFNSYLYEWVALKNFKKLSKAEAFKKKKLKQLKVLREYYSELPDIDKHSKILTLSLLDVIARISIQEIDLY